jgi:hypothetical protein
MKELIVLILVATILFLVWNGRQTGTSGYAVGDVVKDKAVSPSIVQAIIAKFQEAMPTMEPIDTVFVNVQPDGSYNSRILFFDTKHFFGAQYDINSKVNEDGTASIINIGDSKQATPSNGYTGSTYQSWTEVQDNMSAQFKGAMAGYKNQPPQPNLDNVASAYKQNMLTTQTNLQTRS